jgi:pyrroloquinoline-quinone synthase
MTQRLAALEEHYDWIDPAALAYFRARPPLATRDSEHGLEVMLEYCQDLESQQKAVAALQFKCDVLWAQLDAIDAHCQDDSKT